MTITLLLSISIIILSIYAESPCPGILEGTPPYNNDTNIPDLDKYNEALLDLNVVNVFND